MELREMTTKQIYYLTGRGGQLHTGVGQGLIDRGIDVVGREISGKFGALPIQEQIELIKHDIQNEFLSSTSKILAVSYGAYILMHTLAELEPFAGSILLLSPVLGGIVNSEKMKYFIPPRSEKLTKLVESDLFPKPRQLEIHVGEFDWQSPYERSQQFAGSLSAKCFVVPDRGHELGKEYVSPILDRWCM